VAPEVARVTTPLTVDCARCRQLLPSLHEDHPTSPGESADELAAGDRTFALEHLRACDACAASRAELGVALAALRGLELQPDDLARLLPATPAAGDELDTRPFLALVFACVAVAAAIVGGIVAFSGEGRAAPRPPALLLPEAPAALALTVGGEVGLQLDEEALALAPRVDDPNDAGLAAVDEPEPLAVAQAPATDEELLAADADPVALAVAPAPAPVAPAAAGPGAPAAGGAAGRLPPPPAPALNVPQPPTPALLAELARLEVSTSIGFRDVTFYFVRDPDGRDRMVRPRAKAQPPTAREVSPPEPARAAVRPPSAGAAYRLLPGELLDAPCGLRVAMASTRLTGRTELLVEPVAYDAASALDGKARRAPVLRSPVLVPSRARAALIAEPPSAAIGAFVTSLADPSILELRRLRERLDAIEPVALDLERRLHAQLDDARGLRGLAVSIAPGVGAAREGSLRSVDLVGSARELSEVLPRLLRAALLEAILDHPRDDGPMGDPRPANLSNGLATDPLRATIRERLDVFSTVLRAPDAAPDAAYTATTPGAAATLTTAARSGELLHGAVLTR
jgi:hypothetical protein